MRNFKGNNRSGGGRGFSKRRDNDYGRPEMHKTNCDNCGKTCEVPFKPTSGKPIYCSSCFDKDQNDGPRKYGRDRDDRNSRGRDSRGRDSRGRDSSGRDSRKRSFGDRDTEMHSVVCDSCGTDCEVPFRPTKGKPIYCDKCFGSNKENDTDLLKKEFLILNKKLDKIIKILGPEFLDEDYEDEFDEEVGEDEEPKLQTWSKKKKVLKKDKK